MSSLEQAIDLTAEPPLKRQRQSKEEVDVVDDFVASILKAAQDMKEKGWAVIPNVLSEEECGHLKTELWDCVVKVSQGRVDRDDPSTWGPKCWPHSTHYIFQHFNFGNSKAPWRVRTNDRVIEAFAYFFGTDKLTTSFDGAFLQPEFEKIGSYYPKNSSWEHFDQSPFLKGLRCIQGMVLFEGWEEGDAGLKVWTGSHKIHERLVEYGFAPYNTKTNKETGEVISKSPNKKNWLKLTPEMIAAVGEKHPELKWEVVQAPKGSLVLWDSRTGHCGTVPIKGRKNPKERAGVYVSMGPTKWMNATDIKRKVSATLNNRMTSHWPWFSTLFSETWQTYGQPQPPYTKLESERDDSDPRVRYLTCQDAYGATGLLGWSAERQPLLDFVPPRAF